MTVQIRYIFNVGTKFNAFVLACAQLMQSIVLYLICQFFVIRAQNDKRTKINRLLTVILWAFVAVDVGLWIYQWDSFAKNDSFCHSAAFILPEMFNLLVSVLFLGVGIKIRSTAQEFEGFHKESLSDDFVTSPVRQSTNMQMQKELKLKAMKSSVRKMWFVIITEGLINLYSYLYSQTEFFAPDCHYYNKHVYNWNTIINRFLTVIIWNWPIIYIFWP